MDNINKDSLYILNIMKKKGLLIAAALCSLEKDKYTMKDFEKIFDEVDLGYICNVHLLFQGIVTAFFVNEDKQTQETILNKTREDGRAESIITDLYGFFLIVTDVEIPENEEGITNEIIFKLLDDDRAFTSSIVNLIAFKAVTRLADKLNDRKK